MKVGETIEVTIGGHKIADGVIKEVGDGMVVIDVPARRVVMATRTQIEAAPVRQNTGNEHAILGVEQRNAEVDNTDVVPEPQTPAEPAQEAGTEAPVNEVEPAQQTNTASDQTATEPGPVE